MIDANDIDSIIESIPVGTLLTRQQRWDEIIDDGDFDGEIVGGFVVKSIYVVMGVGSRRMSNRLHQTLETLHLTRTTEASGTTSERCPVLRELWLHAYFDELFTGDADAITEKESVTWDVVYVD